MAGKIKWITALDKNRVILGMHGDKDIAIVDFGNGKITTKNLDGKTSKYGYISGFAKDDKLYLYTKTAIREYSLKNFKLIKSTVLNTVLDTDSYQKIRLKVR